MTDSQARPLKHELDLFFAAVTEGYLEIAGAFLDCYPACVNQPVINGAPPLIRAALYKQVDMACFLLARGASADGADLSGWTPLIYAVREGNTRLTGILLNYGASIDLKCDSGLTPLMFAVYEDQIDAIRFLLERGAAVDEKSKDGKTALMIAKEKGKPGAAAVLEQWVEARLRLHAEEKAKVQAARQLERLQSRRPKQSPFGKGGCRP
jgi:ankyrin repeat protein